MTRSIDPEALAATARDFAQAMTPPGQIFCQPELHARDLREIFSSMWLCVGHQSRLQVPGDFFTVEVGHHSIIAAKNNDGRNNAFLNVCRHRGTRISNESSGNCRGFLCPYHAWHYDLNGALKAAPAMDDVPGFKRQDFPLVNVHLDTFHGFLFINLAAECEPLASIFDDFPNLDRYRLPDIVRVARHEYTVESNWKLICENYHECYHCKNAHPQLHRVSHYGDVSISGTSGRNFVGGPMAIRDGLNTMTQTGLTDRPPFAGCTDADRRLVHYFNLLPNFLLSIAPDYVLTHHLWPLGPEQTYVESEWFCAPEQMALPSFDASDAVEFWDTTNRQDWALCENAQKGLRSPGHRPGRYQSGEDCAHQFDQWYVKKMFTPKL